MAAHGEFDAVGDHLARRQRRLHAGVAHRDTVGDGDGAELSRRRADGGNAPLHDLRLAHQRDVAGSRLVPAGRHSYERLMDLLGSQAHRVVEGPMGRPVGPLGGVPAWQPRFQIGLRVHSLLPHPPENNAGRPRPLHVRLTRPYRAPMSLNGMAESRRHWCHRRVWLKCSKPVARQSQVLPVRASRRFKKARKKSGKPKRHRPYSLLRPRAGPSFLFLAARPQPRARGTPGVQKDPRASTPRDIEACRSVCWCRKSAKPKASRARCLRLAPHRPRWSAVRHAVPKNPYVTLHR